MATGDLRISDLFTSHRFPSGLSLFVVILYFPCGVLLAVIRLFLSLQLMLFLSVLSNKTSFIRSLLLKTHCIINGIMVTYEGYDNYSKDKQKVVVCNHVTCLDNVAMEIVLPSVMCDSMSPTPWLINKLLGYTDFGGSKEKENLNTRITESLTESDVPLLVFPEESTTNGQRGLLKFNPWCFELYRSVTPVALEAKSLGDFSVIAHSVLGSGWFSELFWFFFNPFTHYRIRFLSTVSRGDNQTVEEFSQDVQKCIATALDGVQPTNFTAQDKTEYIKQQQRKAVEAASQVLQTPQSRPSTSNGGSSPSRASPRLVNMSQQVKEVLPQVPLEAIQKDLRKTRNVDDTIANILEGKVPYQPETSSQKPLPAKAPTPSPSKASTAAASFSRSSEERHKSFEERKRAMIEDARRIYIAKHGI